MSGYTLIEDFKSLKGYLLLNGFEVDSTLYQNPASSELPFYIFTNRKGNAIKISTDFLSTVKFLNGYGAYIYGYFILENIPQIKILKNTFENNPFEIIPRADATVFFNTKLKQDYSPFKFYVTSDDEKITVLKSLNSNGRSQPFYIYKDLYKLTFDTLSINFPTIITDEFNNYVFPMKTGTITLTGDDAIIIKIKSKDFKVVYLKDLLWINYEYMMIKNYNDITEIYSLEDLKLLK